MFLFDGGAHDEFQPGGGGGIVVSGEKPEGESRLRRSFMGWVHASSLPSTLFWVKIKCFCFGFLESILMVEIPISTRNQSDTVTTLSHAASQDLERHKEDHDMIEQFLAQVQPGDVFTLTCAIERD